MFTTPDEQPCNSVINPQHTRPVTTFTNYGYNTKLTNIDHLFKS
jgi:hypothetical protein